MQTKDYLLFAHDIKIILPMIRHVYSFKFDFNMVI